MEKNADDDPPKSSLCAANCFPILALRGLQAMWVALSCFSRKFVRPIDKNG